MTTHPYVDRRPAVTRQDSREFKLRLVPPIAHFCDRNMRGEVQQEFREANAAGRGR